MKIENIKNYLKDIEIKENIKILKKIIALIK